MAKSINETNTINDKISKWDNFAQGALKDDQMVTFIIPKDRLNPNNHVWLGLNGDECYLAKGVEITVPKTIYDNYMYSYNETIKAEERINTDNQVNS